MKDQKVDFTFNYVLEDEDGKQSKNTLRESFRYAVDALNLMTVTAGGEKGFVETGKEDEMLLEFDLGQMREMLEEAVEEEIDKMENADASAAEAKRASASDLLIKWDDESSDGAGSKKDPAVIKNLKCEVETFGLKLEKFKAVPVKDDDNFGTSLKCNFYVSRKTLPGTYYGRVNASYKIKGKSFHTVQGFQVVVKQETGELELVGKIGNSEIVMTGPVSSFPKADELSLKVSEVTQEQQEMVDEALQKKAEEEGSEIKQYKALDIKLMADGVETEPEGDVQVRFKNVELENADEKKEAEQEKAEEQSIVKKAVRKVMSLFSAKNDEEDVAAVAEVDEAEDTTADRSEGAAESSENIKVLHLDEDAVVANEMKSEVQENGDVVMDTDHFSIYVVVDMGKPGGQIEVTVEHWASIKTIAAMNGNGDIKDEDTNPYTVVLDNQKYTEDKTGKWIKLIKDSNGDKQFHEYFKDEVYNRYEQEINMKTIPEIEIYEPSESIIIQNEKQISSVESLSKLSTELDGTVKSAEQKGYRIKEIWVTEDTNNLGKQNWQNGTYKKYKIGGYDEDGNANEVTEGSLDLITTEDGEKKAITLKADSTIRFIYEEATPGIEYFPVTFYDHNVGEGIDNKGINEDTFFKDKTPGAIPRLESGQKTSGNKTELESNNIWNGKLINTANREDGRKLAYAIRGIVLNQLDSNGNLQFDPGINYNTKFFEEAKLGENWVSKEFKDYELGFKRTGDTYILTNVKDTTNEELTCEELDNLRYSGRSWHQDESKKSPLFSNSFWPLDNVEYEGKDPMREGGSDSNGASKEEDDSKTHNWHFGMVFEFDFTVDDYEGPMNFYFRGDDDFWMFVDGQKAIDIGGIHSAAGKAVDMKKWLETNKNTTGVAVKGTHHVKIYFMERGGFGSCCYMQFTLPNCETVSFPGVPTTDIAVEKRWDDGDDSLRPEHITVQLLRKEVRKDVDANGKEIEVIVTENDKVYEDGYRVLDNTDIDEPEKGLGGLSDVWKCSWNALPKVNPNNTSNQYFYKVREKPVEGYTADYKYINTTTNAEISEGNVGSDDKITCKITNTLDPTVKVEVKKIWHDNGEEGNTRPKEITLQLQYSKDGGDTFSNFIGDKGILTLDGKPDEEKIQEENQNPEEEQVPDGESTLEEEQIPDSEQTPNGNQVQKEEQFQDGIQEEGEGQPQDDEDSSDGNQTSESKQSPSAIEYAPWEGRFENLPYYADNVETGNNEETSTTRVPVTYRVCEVRQNADGTYTVLTDDNNILPGSNGYNYIVTYETEQKFPGESQDPQTRPDEGTVVAITTITNTLTKDMAVTKKWDIPSKLSSELKSSLIAKIGLFKQITNNENGTDISSWQLIKNFTGGSSDAGKAMTWSNSESNNEKDYLLECDASSISWYGEWKNIPQYDSNGGEIIYRIFELDNSKHPIIIPDSGSIIKTINGYKYEIIDGISSDDETTGDETGSPESEKENVVTITNKYMADLIITKKVENADAGDKEFNFTATIIKDGKTVILSNPGTNADYTVNEDGEVSFSLKANETITIPVPVGSQVTITEVSHAGYNVSYMANKLDADGEINGSITLDGDGHGITCTIPIPSDGTVSVGVTCTNTPGVVLPDTGGPGLLMMSRLGWMLLLLALLMAGMEIQFYGERRNRKTVNAQREGSREFDPEDY